MELYVEGSRVGSLDGLQRASKLRVLWIAGMASPELSIVASLPALEHLTLDSLTGDLNFAPLRSARRLKSLTVVVEKRHDAVSLAQLDLTGLRSLARLELEWIGAGPLVPFGLEWLSQAAMLEHLALRNFSVSDDDLELIRRTGEPLECVALSPRPPAAASPARTATERRVPRTPGE